MTTTPARPDLAYINATRLDPAVLIAELRDLLGAKLVAYLGGVKETRGRATGSNSERCSNAPATTTSPHLTDTLDMPSRSTTST